MVDVAAHCIRLCDDGAVIWSGLDAAIVGSARVWRDREWRNVLVYAYDAIYDIIRRDMESDDDATEYIEHNIVCWRNGPYTPLIVQDWS